MHVASSKKSRRLRARPAPAAAPRPKRVEPPPSHGRARLIESRTAYHRVAAHVEQETIVYAGAPTEPPVFLLELPRPFQLADAHPGEALLPGVRRSAR